VGSSVLGSSVLRRRLVRGGAGRCAAAGAAVAMVQLRSYVYGIIAQEVERRLVLALADTAGKGAVVELQDVLRRLAFDTICKISFGLDPSCLEPETPVSRFTAARVRRRVAGGVERGSIDRKNEPTRKRGASRIQLDRIIFLHNQ
jgi:hypothetical protein